MNCMYVVNGVVENVAVFDLCPSGWVVQPDGFGIGDTDNGDGTFSKPVKVVTDVELAFDAREKRDSLLSKADIAINIVEDAGLDSSALRAYRQALRDIPQQVGFPLTINWPTMPVF